MAIDFTASNRPPSDPTSLHYVSREPNRYQRALRQVASILAYYDQDQLFPAYGSARPPAEGREVE